MQAAVDPSRRYATKGKHMISTSDATVFAAAKFTLTSKDTPMKVGRKRREVFPPPLPEESSSAEPTTIRHSKRLAGKHVMDFSVFAFDDPIEHLQDEERKLLKHLSMDSDNDDYTPEGEEGSKKKTKVKPDTPITTTTTTINTKKIAPLPPPKPVTHHYYYHAKPQAQQLIAPRSPALVLKLASTSDGSAESSITASPVTSPLPAHPADGEHLPHSPSPTSTVSTLPATSPLPLSSSWSSTSPPSAAPTSTGSTTPLPPSSATTPDTTVPPITTAVPLTPESSLPASPASSTSSSPITQHNPSKYSSHHHLLYLPPMEHSCLLIPKSEPPASPTNPEISKSTPDSNGTEDLDDYGVPLMEESSTPFDAAELKTESPLLSGSDYHHHVLPHHLSSVETHPNATNGRGPERVKRKYTKRGTGKTALAKAAAKAKTVGAITAALSRSLPPVPSSNSAARMSSIPNGVTSAVTLQGTSPLSHPSTSPPQAPTPTSISPPTPSSSLALIPSSAEQSSDIDSNSLLAVKMSALKMLQSCVDQGLITADQYKAKQQQFLLSIAF